MSEKIAAWLKIAAATTITTEQLTGLLATFGDVTAIVKAETRALAEHGLDESTIRSLQTPVDAETRAVENWLSQPATHFICRGETEYPPLLQSLTDAPPLLYVHGNPDALVFPLLAIVGSRNPTRGGESTARQFAMQLCSAGLGIVSGLALGIDAAAHTGALDAGGLTIAVLGTGIDRVYPAANLGLAHRIAEHGAVVSEFPLGTEPRRYNFPRRNRLISGLALGTLVVEAAERSGSLITARLAAEQGREVFAIPGSIHNPMARGCHRLIRDGARLVESTQDIFAEIAALTGALVAANVKNDDIKSTATTAGKFEDDDQYTSLLQALAWEPCGTDVIAERSGLTIAEVSSMLLILELEGVVEALPGGRYARLRQERQDP